jgi:hypothetical protein
LGDEAGGLSERISLTGSYLRVAEVEDDAKDEMIKIFDICKREVYGSTAQVRSIMLQRKCA